MGLRRYGRHRVETSREQKVLFASDGITKGDLIDYYEAAWGRMGPHLRERPLVMERFPDGIAEDGFYQKQVGAHFPDWIRRARVQRRDGSFQELVVCHARATLAYLADQACVTPHVWLSRVGALDVPDQLVLDLDPSGTDFAEVRVAARRCKELLDELELRAFVKTTGSRGVHVVLPLRPGAPFDEARGFARELARELVRRHPASLTDEQRKEKRGGKLYLDTARNAYAQTVVAPYAVRALPGGPIAMPVRWDELDALDARSFRLAGTARRDDDPWKGWRRHAFSLRAARERLRAIAPGREAAGDA